MRENTKELGLLSLPEESLNGDTTTDTTMDAQEPREQHVT